MDDQDKQVLVTLCKKHALAFKARERQAKINSPEINAINALAVELKAAGIIERYPLPEIFTVMEELGYGTHPHQ